ncbi:MAG: diguanylate cyclase, partial [Spirochaetota bacterium]
MEELTIQYCGLTLKTPLIIGSSPLTSHVASAKQLEEAGAGAIIIKSLFEEQIQMEAHSVIESGSDFNDTVEAQDYISYYVKQNSLSDYIDLVKSLKSAITIPVIASINCATNSNWISFAKTIENAGADAIEVNIYIVPGYHETDSIKIESMYYDIISTIKKTVSIPIMVKLADRFTTLAGTLIRLSKSGADGMVLFNRFLGHDISLQDRSVVIANQYSKPSE